MFHENTFTSLPPALHQNRRSRHSSARLSLRKIVRLAIVLMMSALCWMGIGWFALEVFQLAGH